MKKLIPSVLIACALSLPAWAAEVTTKISGVHLCCKNCVVGVEKAVGEVPGVTTSVDKDAGTVSLTGPDTATVQKGANALVAAGYFGKSSETSIKVAADTGAKGKQVKSLTVKGVHLCCAKCANAVTEALKPVAGVTGNTAEKGATSFVVTGDFNDKEVFAALQKAGLSGKAK